MHIKHCAYTNCAAQPLTLARIAEKCWPHNPYMMRTLKISSGTLARDPAAPVVSCLNLTFPQKKYKHISHPPQSRTKKEKEKVSGTGTKFPASQSDTRFVFGAPFAYRPKLQFQLDYHVASFLIAAPPADRFSFKRRTVCQLSHVAFPSPQCDNCSFRKSFAPCRRATRRSALLDDLEF